MRPFTYCVKDTQQLIYYGIMKHLKLRICKDFNKNLHGMTLNLESGNHPTERMKKRERPHMQNINVKKLIHFTE